MAQGQKAAAVMVRPTQPSHDVYSVEGDGADKSFWTRIGSAWPHTDGKGVNLTLTAIPLNGRIVLRMRKEAGQ
ncbi:hypothetical protein ATER59S_01527 [Aquamicrobium terrae]